MTNRTVKSTIGIASASIAFCLASTAAFAAGGAYANGTVSPFAPAFYGIGICTGGTSSEVNGVAADGGTLLGAVGNCGTPTNSSNQTAAILFTPSTGLIVLPQADSALTTTAFRISADGKIKVGSSVQACYWDATNQFHYLARENLLHSNEAYAVSGDGSTIGGNVLDDNPPNQDGYFGSPVLWLTGGNGFSRLTLPGNFTYGVVYGLSADGQLRCGSADDYTPKQGREQAFVQKAGGSLELLPALSDPPNFDGAVAIIATPTGYMAVGQSANVPAYWLNGLVGRLPLPTGVGGFATDIASGNRLIVGYSISNDPEYNAVLWDGQTATSKGTVAGTLRNTYGVNVGAWRLKTAGCVSADGYTVGGQGINPSGRFEGWIAVMPPILHPPILVKPAPQHLVPGERFTLNIALTNADLVKTDLAFTAKGLPPGFQINSVFGTITGTWDRSKVPPGNYTITVTGATSDGTGSTTFVLTLLSPQGVLDDILQGHGYLPQIKAAGDTAYYASTGDAVSTDGRTAVGTDGFGSDARAYRWDEASGISGLPLLDGALRTYSSALAVSADGNTIAGQAASPPDATGSDHSVATVWTTRPGVKALRSAPTHYAEGASSASLVAINIGLFPQGTSSIANAVSADGSVVVGYGGHKIDGVPYQVYQAFRWTAKDGMVGLGWLSGGRRFSEAYGISADGSTVVGSSDSAAGQQAMRYTAANGMQGLGLPAGAIGGRAVAASADGFVIVGFNTTPDGIDRAFRWTATTGMTDLGVLPGDAFSEATAVSADGSVVVGQSAPGFNQERAFIWDQQNGMRDLKSVLVAGNPQLSNWQIRGANAISGDGKVVVGVGKDPNGGQEGFTAVLQAKPPQPLNISTRMRVLNGDNALIGGFIITGTDPKKVIIRGLGPSLAASGLQNVLSDPTLELHQGNTVVAKNDNWGEQQTEVAATGIAPANDLESSIVSTLSPAAYTAILRDKNNQPGVGLVEVYDLGGNSKLANLSTRGFVDSGDNVMIGGFIVGGGGPGGVTRIVVRGLGPSLAGAGVSGALADPILELHDNNGLTVAANNDWKDSQQAELAATGIQPANDLESAIIETLAPGAYTAIVRGNNGGVGVGLVEVYNLQN